MNYDYKESHQSRITELLQERNALIRKQEELAVSPAEAKDALELHLSQLKQLDYILEDSICVILRKVQESGELQKEIDEKNRLINMHQRELNEYYG